MSTGFRTIARERNMVCDLLDPTSAHAFLSASFPRSPGSQSNVTEITFAECFKGTDAQILQEHDPLLPLALGQRRYEDQHICITIFRGLSGSVIKPFWTIKSNLSPWRPANFSYGLFFSGKNNSPPMKYSKETRADTSLSPSWRSSAF